MITVYTRIDKNTISVDTGKEARRIARNKAPKPGATRRIGDKRNTQPKHKKPLTGEYD